MPQRRTDTSADLSGLRERLVDCASLYLTPELANQRLAVAVALFEVAKFLKASGVPEHLILPVIRPAQALAERENNSLDELFCVRSRGGAPRLTMNAHLRTAILAALANSWLRLRNRDGRTQSIKLSEAARHMRGPWFQNVTASKLKAAREVVSQESEKHPAVEFYRRFGDFFEKVEKAVGPERAFFLMIRYIDSHEVSYSMGISKKPPLVFFPTKRLPEAVPQRSGDPACDLAETMVCRGTKHPS